MSDKLCDHPIYGSKLRPFPEVDEFFNEFDENQLDFYALIIAYKAEEIWKKNKDQLDEKNIESLKIKHKKIHLLIKDIKSIFVDEKMFKEKIVKFTNSSNEDCVEFIREWIRIASYFTNCKSSSRSNVIYHSETKQFEMFFNKGLLEFLVWIEIIGGLSVVAIEQVKQ